MKIENILRHSLKYRNEYLAILTASRPERSLFSVAYYSRRHDDALEKESKIPYLILESGLPGEREGGGGSSSYATL